MICMYSVLLTKLEVMIYMYVLLTKHEVKITKN